MSPSGAIACTRLATNCSSVLTISLSCFFHLQDNSVVCLLYPYLSWPFSFLDDPSQPSLKYILVCLVEDPHARCVMFL